MKKHCWLQSSSICYNTSQTILSRHLISRCNDTSHPYEREAWKLLSPAQVWYNMLACSKFQKRNIELDEYKPALIHLKLDNHVHFYMMIHTVKGADEAAKLSLIHRLQLLSELQHLTEGHLYSAAVQSNNTLNGDKDLGRLSQPFFFFAQLLV